MKTYAKIYINTITNNDSISKSNAQKLQPLVTENKKKWLEPVREIRDELVHNLLGGELNSVLRKGIQGDVPNP